MGITVTAKSPTYRHALIVGYTTFQHLCMHIVYCHYPGVPLISFSNDWSDLTPFLPSGTKDRAFNNTAPYKNCYCRSFLPRFSPHFLAASGETFSRTVELLHSLLFSLEGKLRGAGGKEWGSERNPRLLIWVMHYCTLCTVMSLYISIPLLLVSFAHRWQWQVTGDMYGPVHRRLYLHSLCTPVNIVQRPYRYCKCHNRSTPCPSWTCIHHTRINRYEGKEFIRVSCRNVLGIVVMITLPGALS